MNPMVVEVINVEDQGVRVRTNKQPSNKRWKSLVTKEERQRLDGEAAVQELEQQRLHYEAALQEFERRLEANSGSCYAMGPTGSSSSCNSSSVSRAGEAAATAAADAEKALMDRYLKLFADTDAAVKAEQQQLTNWGQQQQQLDRYLALERGSSSSSSGGLPSDHTMMNLHELARAQVQAKIDAQVLMETYRRRYEEAEAEIAQQEAEDFFS